MSLEDDMPCKCEPCPIDLDAFGYRTQWEDPLFAGKRCCWHKQMQGRRGCISPDIRNKNPCIYVDLEKSRFYVSAKREKEWIDYPLVKSITKCSGGKLVIRLKVASFTVPASELPRWGKVIGAKRK